MVALAQKFSCNVGSFAARGRSSTAFKSRSSNFKAFQHISVTRNRVVLVKNEWRSSSDHLSSDSGMPTISSAALPVVAQHQQSLWKFAKPLAMCCAIAACAAFLAPSAYAAAKASAAAAASTGASEGIIGLAKSALSFILHLDVHLGDIVARYGPATYAILFAIVFCETGLVVTPFLPGDSLLFATGALAALGKLNVMALLAIYITAATLGDAVNYAIGNYFGAKAIKSSLIKKEYIDKTEEFYNQYGGKTVVLARFVPIVRTFAPFVAGIGSMSYAKFGLYNVVGAVLWTAICTGAGFAFGNVPAVHENFSLVVLGIVVVSVLPILFEVLAAKKKGGKSGAGKGASGTVSRDGGGLSVDFRS